MNPNLETYSILRSTKRKFNLARAICRDVSLSSKNTRKLIGIDRSCSVTNLTNLIFAYFVDSSIGKTLVSLRGFYTYFSMEQRSNRNCLCRRVYSGANGSLIYRRMQMFGNQFRLIRDSFPPNEMDRRTNQGRVKKRHEYNPKTWASDGNRPGSTGFNSVSACSRIFIIVSVVARVTDSRGP